MEYLLNRGVNPITANTHGMNAIHYATELESLPALKLLLEGHKNSKVCWLENGWRALDVGTKEDGLLPLHIAAMKGNKWILKYLMKVVELRSEDFMSVSEALEYKAKYSMTPLLMAVQYNKIKAFEYLLQIGSDVYVKNARMQNVLHLAAINENKDIVESLMRIDREEGRLMYAKDYRGKTPIQYTKHEEIKYTLISIWREIENSNLMSIQSLVEHTKGEVLKLKHSKNGNTPLHYAITLQKKAVVRLLMEYNADKSITNMERKTPEDLAEEIEDEVTRKSILSILNTEVKETVMLKQLTQIKGRRVTKNTMELIKDVLELSEKEAMNMMKSEN